MAVIDELAAVGELVKGKCAQVPVAVVRGYLDSPLPVADGPGATTLVRGADQDLFSLGTAEARADGLRAAARLTHSDRPPFPVLDETDVAKAVTRALAVIAPGSTGTFDLDLLPNPVPPERLDQAAHDQPDHHGTAAPPAARNDAAPAARSDTDVARADEGTGAHAARCRIVCRPANPRDTAALVSLGVDVQRLRAALAAEGLGSTMDTVEGDGYGPRVVVMAG
jgi:coenzyme F420-0:L-glutamate ligase/coenzyme F420-1:gamma-L-glutamate ligase